MPDPLPAPDRLRALDDETRELDADVWDQLPRAPHWALDFPSHWSPGEDGAKARLEAFIDSALDGYDTDRDLPGVEGTSRLSPHLHAGSISPRQSGPG